MTEIRMLDQATINQIAAGEVIERPASIVKELVENAIDAGASSIQVEIREGGISYIRVTDNGFGIAADQIRTAFLRHSTSKITDASDLTRIGSLGFRGEALASIAAVSQVEVLTRVPSAVTGVRYVIEGGVEKKLEEAACPVGTTIKVENLFFNTPVRLKFLKSANAEASQVTDIMGRLVMGHPEISFRLIRNGKEPSIHSPGNNQIKNGIYAVYGRDIVTQMMPIHTDGSIRIDGFISKPQQTRANRTYENYYLNGRYIRSRVLEQAIEDAYRDYIVPGTFPIIVLMIRMDPAELDVNVHPSKMDVRFTKEKEVGEAVYQAIAACLKNTDLTARLEGSAKVQPKVDPVSVIPEKMPELAVPVSRPEEERMPRPVYEQRDIFSTQPEEKTAPVVKEPAVPYGEPKTPEPEPKNTRPVPESLRIVGQVFRTYWIAEAFDTIYLVDQHAAHERVLYDRLKEKLSEGELDSQILLEPMIISLPPEDYRAVLEQRQVFERLGYGVQPFGDDAVIVREVPFIFNGPMGREDFQTMVDLLQNGGRRVDTQILIDRMAMASCKAAVKGNDALSLEEIQSLMDQLLHSSNPFNCPHGRPTMLTMTRQELEHRFGRS